MTNGYNPKTMCFPPREVSAAAHGDKPAGVTPAPYTPTKTFLHGDGGWRFATSPSSGSQPFRLLAGECLIAEISPCPTFGSGWSDEEILALIAAAPELLAAANHAIAALDAAGAKLRKLGLVPEDRQPDPAIDPLRAAIARATGGDK